MESRLGRNKYMESHLSPSILMLDIAREVQVDDLAYCSARWPQSRRGLLHLGMQSGPHTDPAFCLAVAGSSHRPKWPPALSDGT